MCRFRKDIVLGLIDKHHNNPGNWADTKYILGFIKENDDELYSLYDGSDCAYPKKGLGLKVGQNLSHSTKLKFIEKDGLRSAYRFNPACDGLIDDIEEYVNGIDCI